MSFCACNRTYMSLTTDSRGNTKAADFDFYPMKKGATFLIFKGIMMSKNWDDHKKAVVKVLRQDRGDHNLLDFYFHAATTTSDVLIKFKTMLNDTQQAVIVFSNCYEATMDSVSSYSSLFRRVKHYTKKIAENEHVIIENFIHGLFQDFISEDGNVLSCCPYILEAFSHYSYHYSNGQFLISGLKGVRNCNKFYMSVPTIHSRIPGHYGKRDKGIEGMDNFFSSHTCNDICRHLMQYDTRDSSPPSYWTICGDYCACQH